MLKVAQNTRRGTRIWKLTFGQKVMTTRKGLPFMACVFALAAVYFGAVKLGLALKRYDRVRYFR
jgi:hypothetical protein